MKICKCKQCGDSKNILIEINSFEYEFLCKDCYNLNNSTNYFLRKQPDRNDEVNLFEPSSKIFD